MEQNLKEMKRGMFDKLKAVIIMLVVQEVVAHMIFSYVVASVYGNLNTANLPPNAVTTINTVYSGIVIALDLSIVILIITAAAVIIMGLMGSFGRAPGGGGPMVT